MYKKLLTSAISLFISSQAMALDYQFTANLDAQHTNVDRSKYNNASESDTVQASGTYYFAPVKTAGHPLAEAAFLERNSSLSLAIARGETDENERTNYASGYETANYNDKTTRAIVGGETYVFDNFLYLAGYISDIASKYKDTYRYRPYSNPQNVDTDSYSYKDSDNMVHMNLGLAPAPGLLIWSEFDEDSDDFSSLNLNAKYVMEFGGSALNIQAGLGKNSVTSLHTTFNPDPIKLNFASIDYDSSSIYALGDFYFTNSLSLGLGVSQVDIEAYRGVVVDIDDVYMIRGQVFIGDQVSIRANILKDDAEDSFLLGASVRF